MNNQKRMMTTDEARVEISKVDSVSVSVYGIVAVVVYTKDRSATLSGKYVIGLTPFGTFQKGKFEDGVSKYNDTQAIAYEVNFGEWLEERLQIKPSNHVELEVNRAWKGYAFSGNAKGLTQQEREDLITEFVGTVNQRGVKSLNKIDESNVQNITQ